MTPRIALRCATIFLGLVAAAECFGEATRLEITARRYYGTFASGEFEMIQGRLVGEISPQEKIPGIDKAPRNARGNVEYATRIVLIAPTDPRRGNGTLIVDVPNRGNAYGHALYNSPRDEFFLSGSYEQGTGFLQERGFTLAEVQWEIGKGAEIPTFTDEQGKMRYVEGVGFAIFRDATDFLARSTAESNPLRGAVKRTIASGKSQSARFLKTFLLNGFNAVGERRAFDGMHLFVPGSGYLPILQTGTGPVSSGDAFPLFDTPDMRGVTEEPLGNDQLVAQVEARGEKPPKLMLLNSATDYYSRLASLSRTGSSGATDRAIPANMRVYDVASGAHVLGSAGTGCKMTTARLDWNPVSRATLLHLNAWIADGTEPPPTKLVPLERPADDLPTVRAPAHLPAAVIQVPKRDADGNSMGGVRLPDVVAPVGTHGAQNLPPSRGCMLVGAYVPFATTRALRESAGDARLSLAERYRSRDDYVNSVRAAARDLMREGFLLPEDAAIIVQAAAANAAMKPPR